MTLFTFAQTMTRFCRTYHASITSWHRTPSHNAKVGGAPKSQHLDFKAVDIVLDDWTTADLAIGWLLRQGLFVLDERETANHIHVDDRNDATPAPEITNGKS